MKSQTFHRVPIVCLCEVHYLLNAPEELLNIVSGDALDDWANTEVLPQDDRCIVTATIRVVVSVPNLPDDEGSLDLFILKESVKRCEVFIPGDYRTGNEEPSREEMVVWLLSSSGGSGLEPAFLLRQETKVVKRAVKLAGARFRQWLKTFREREKELTESWGK